MFIKPIDKYIQNNYIIIILETMDFEEQKQQIISMLQKGDKQEIARMAEATTETVRKTFQRSSVSEMQMKERRVWEASIELLNSRKREIEKIERKTAKLYGKI